jgi:DNA adenine methylase
MSQPRSIISPLRYPGSKQALVDYVESFLRANGFVGREWVEPCAGGASVALSLLGRDLVSRATIVEKDPLIYAFWKALKTDAAVLCEMVRELEVSLFTWQRFQKYRAPDALDRYSILELGLAGLFFNRANYSGIIGAKPIGGMSQSSEYKINCRFTKPTVIDRMVDAASLMDRITVIQGDVVSYLRRSQARLSKGGAVVYVDPPYYLQGQKLYRYHFQDRDHVRLAGFLNGAAFPWLVSYDNVPFVVNLFRGQTVRPIWLQYTVREARRVDELLITNQDCLPLPESKARPARAIVDQHIARGPVARLRTKRVAAVAA